VIDCNKNRDRLRKTYPSAVDSHRSFFGFIATVFLDPTSIESITTTSGGVLGPLMVSSSVRMPAERAGRELGSMVVVCGELCCVVGFRLGVLLSDRSVA
jgi:hypothetical protein